MTRLMLFHMNTIGLRSGEYGGRKTSEILSSIAFSLDLFTQYDLKLSKIITILFVGFSLRISSNNSQTSSFFECSLESTQLIPLIA